MNRAVHATIDGTSTFYMTYFFLFIDHNLPFMNEDEGFVPLFTRVLKSISCL